MIFKSSDIDSTCENLCSVYFLVSNVHDLHVTIVIIFNKFTCVTGKLSLINYRNGFLRSWMSGSGC